MGSSNDLQKAKLIETICGIDIQGWRIDYGIAEVPSFDGWVNHQHTGRMTITIDGMRGPSMAEELAALKDRVHRLESEDIGKKLIERLRKDDDCDEDDYEE